MKDLVKAWVWQETVREKDKPIFIYLGRHKRHKWYWVNEAGFVWPPSEDIESPLVRSPGRRLTRQIEIPEHIFVAICAQLLSQ